MSKVLTQFSHCFCKGLTAFMNSVGLLKGDHQYPATVCKVVHHSRDASKSSSIVAMFDAQLVTSRCVCSPPHPHPQPSFQATRCCLPVFLLHLNGWILPSNPSQLWQIAQPIKEKLFGSPQTRWPHVVAPLLCLHPLMGPHLRGFRGRCACGFFRDRVRRNTQRLQTNRTVRSYLFRLGICWKASPMYHVHTYSRHSYHCLPLIF